MSLGPFAAGLGKGYTSPAIASLQQLQVRAVFNASAATFIVTEQQASWIASLSLLGEVLLKLLSRKNIFFVHKYNFHFFLFQEHYLEGYSAEWQCDLVENVL